jgi:hypothetical protein
MPDNEYMKSAIYTLNINNYFPEMLEITIPLMREYANRIGSDFIEITERKFPNWHMIYEKLQIYELGKNYDWNIFFDGDLLVNPLMFQDLTKLDNDRVYFKDGYRANIKFKMTSKFLPVFKKDGRNIGISTCFVSSPKSCHTIWKPLDITPDEAINEIIIGHHDKSSATNNAQDELALSYNLAKYHLKFSGIDQRFIFHPYDSISNEEKLKQVKDILNKWR